MASTDLDPVFVKALRLMHSKSKEAGDQLRQMLDDLIAQRKGLMQTKVSGQETKIFQYCTCPAGLGTYNSTRPANTYTCPLKVYAIKNIIDFTRNY